MPVKKNDVADAIRESLISSDIPSSSLNAANLVDVIGSMAAGISRLATTVMPSDLGLGDGANGGKVGCLVEAVCDVAAGLGRIADSINCLASEVSSLKNSDD